MDIEIMPYGSHIVVHGIDCICGRLPNKSGSLCAPSQ
jgi:hypothetical protein